MKVVIIGAEGMLGSALVKTFGAAHEVKALGRSDVDMTDADALRRVLTAIAPEVIINSAAFNSVDEAEKSEEAFALAQKINGEAVGTLAEIAKELGAPLVHFSTEYVFSGENKNGYTEDAAPSPINRYGQTKLLGEQLLQKNTDQFYLIRLSRMFGPAGSSSAAKKSFVDIMINLVEKQGKQELKIVNEEISCPTYSLDLARLVVDIVTTKKPFGTYHASNSDACTWYEFAEEIFKLKKYTVKVVPVTGSEFPRPARRPRFTRLLNTKLPVSRSWRAALAEYLLP